MGGLRTSMATCGYRDIAEFNRAELMVAPALQTEGKQLQREQGVGMGAGEPRPSVPPPTSPSAAADPKSERSEAAREEAVVQATAEVREELPAATDEVVVLDYGGQYSQLIARRVRESGVFSELLPHHVGAEEVARRRPKGVILSGGPASVYADGAPALEPELLELGRSRARASVTGCSCWPSSSAAGCRAPRSVSSAARSSRSAKPGGCWPGRRSSRRCWMSHRDTVFGRPRDSPRWPPRRRRRWRRSSRASAACTGSSSTPRSSTPRTASRC